MPPIPPKPPSASDEVKIEEEFNPDYTPVHLMPTSNAASIDQQTQSFEIAKEAAKVPPPAKLMQVANPSKNFFQKFEGELKNIFDWAPKIAEKAVVVVNEAAVIEPAFLDNLKLLLANAASIAGHGAIAVGEKGLNPALDLQVLQNVEDLTKNFANFVPIVEKAYADVKSNTPTQGSFDHITPNTPVTAVNSPNAFYKPAQTQK